MCSRHTLLVYIYLQLEEIQTCHSHALLILWWWPVQVPTDTFADKAEELIKHLECFFANIHHKCNAQVDTPLTAAAPSKALKPRDVITTVDTARLGIKQNSLNYITNNNINFCITQYKIITKHCFFFHINPLNTELNPICQ